MCLLCTVCLLYVYVCVCVCVCVRVHSPPLLQAMQQVLVSGCLIRVLSLAEARSETEAVLTRPSLTGPRRGDGQHLQKISSLGLGLLCSGVRQSAGRRTRGETRPHLPMLSPHLRQSGPVERQALVRGSNVITLGCVDVTLWQRSCFLGALSQHGL